MNLDHNITTPSPGISAPQLHCQRGALPRPAAERPTMANAVSLLLSRISFLRAVQVLFSDSNRQYICLLTGSIFFIYPSTCVRLNPTMIGDYFPSFIVAAPGGIQAVISLPPPAGPLPPLRPPHPPGYLHELVRRRRKAFRPEPPTSQLSC
jgi:hypothetical protein